MRTLKEEGAVLHEQLQRQKAVLSKSSTSTSAPSNSAAIPVDVSAPDSCPKTLDDLRKEERLQDHVAQRLAQLDVKDDSSSDGTDGQDEDSDDSKRASHRSTGKSLRSGKTVKPTSKVVRPQLWPHSELNVAACSNDVTYDKLTIEEFVAGYTTILHSRKLATTEKQAREAHLIHLMYLAMTYEWQAVLAYHGAVLLEIERGHSPWGDSFHHLDARILQGHFKSSGNSLRSSASKDLRPVLFCWDYQRGTCNFPSDHSGSLRGEVKFLRHICATCWVRERKKRAHRENSEQCPLRQTSEVNPPAVSGNSS